MNVQNRDGETRGDELKRALTPLVTDSETARRVLDLADETSAEA